jgi:hypothetical protein
MTVRFAYAVEHGDIDGIVAVLPPTAHEGGGREWGVAPPSSASAATADSVAYPRAWVHGHDRQGLTLYSFFRYPWRRTFA